MGDETKKPLELVPLEEEAPPPPVASSPGPTRYVEWIATVVGAEDDKAALLAALRLLHNPENHVLCFSVSVESGPTEFYQIDPRLFEKGALNKEEPKP